MLSLLKKHPARIILGGILLLQLIMLLIAGAMRGNFVSSYDGIGYFVWLRSPIIDGDLQFKNDYQIYNPNKNAPDPNIIYPETGNTYNHYSAGMPFLCAPGYLLGQCAAWILDKDVSGFGWGPQIGYLFNSFLYYALGLMLFYLFLAKRVHWRTALWISFFIACGTVTGYYAWNEPFFVNSVEFFFVVLMLYWVFDPKPIDNLNLIMGAILFAFGFWVRADMILFALPALGRFFGQKKCIQNITKFCLVFMICIIPHYVTRYLISGEFNLLGGYDKSHIVGGGYFSNLSNPNIDLVMLSTNNGLLFWCPALLLGFLGLVFLSFRYRLLWILFVFLKIYLISSWNAWDGSASMGPRTLNSLLPILCFAMALLFFNSNRFKKTMPLLLVLSCVWFWGLVFQRFTGQLPYYEGREQIDRVVISEPLSKTPYKRVVSYQFLNLKYLFTPRKALEMIRNN